MSHETLANYYRKIFFMKSSYNYSIIEIEGMYPYELDIHYDLIVEDINKKEDENLNGTQNFQ